MEKRNIKEITSALKHLISPNLTMNELLVIQYKAETGATFFKTFKQWKEEGKMIRKGERGYPVFSRPIGVIKAEKGKEARPEENKYFGTCYLFNEMQVN
jgi:antirestriction protein ArdC